MSDLVGTPVISEARFSRIKAELNFHCSDTIKSGCLNHALFQNCHMTDISKNSRNLMSRVVRKPDFCICENKDADQLRGNREADQRLCFRYTDSTIPLLSKSEISSHGCTTRFVSDLVGNPEYRFSHNEALIMQCNGNTKVLSNFENRVQFRPVLGAWQIIMITCPYDLDPLISQFYIVKLGFTGVYIIFSFLL